MSDPALAYTGKLYTVARQVLTVVSGGLSAAGRPAPSRQYVADGNLVAWDCEQLVVAVDSTQGHQGNVAVEDLGPAFAMAPRAATLGVWLLRSAPMLDDEGTPPAAAEIDANAEIVLADPMVMLWYLWHAHERDELAPCKGLSFQRWQALGPMGGLTGGVLRLNVDLVGI